MQTPSVFLDSDVVISSLLSSRGAARFLIKEERIQRYLSTRSCDELASVATRLHIDAKDLAYTISCCQVVPLTDPTHALMAQYASYVIDANDAHIVAGAVASQARFLTTYNLKHFYIDRIKEDHDILVIPPAFLIQYLRSLY